VSPVFRAVTISLFVTFAATWSQDYSSAGRADDSPILSENINPLLKKPITLRSQDASLSQILKILAERSGMNFVTAEGIYKEKLTIMLEGTPLDEAIDLVVRAAGLSYEIIGNSVLIAEPDKIKDDVGQQGYVIALKHAKAEEVADMLKDLSANIKVDKGGNKLVCFTNPRSINEIERIVKSIDQPHPLVVLETRLIELSMDDLSKYGIDWGNLSSFRGQVSVPELTLQSGNLTAPEGLKLAKIDVVVGLDLLLQNGDARLLMDSKLTTTNNREASIHIGEIIPYLVQVPGKDQLGFTTFKIEKENVGVQLTMTPHINIDGQVVLTIEPNVSNIAGWKGQGGDIPLIRTRKAKTTVRVDDGQTVFLAGLLSEEKALEIRKLPILGQIPVLGLLFQNRKTTTKKTNLILEITPRIIRTKEDMAKYTNTALPPIRKTDTDLDKYK